MVHAHWGTGSKVFASLFLPEADSARLAWFAGYQRIGTSPQAAADFIVANSQMDARPSLAVVTAPALVLHRRDDSLIPNELGQYLGRHVPRARFRQLEGRHHLQYFGDSAAVVDAVDAFLQPEPSVLPVSPPREALTTRELDVLRLLAEGHRNREIAERLHISAATVSR